MPARQRPAILREFAKHTIRFIVSLDMTTPVFSATVLLLRNRYLLVQHRTPHSMLEHRLPPVKRSALIPGCLPLRSRLRPRPLRHPVADAQLGEDAPRAIGFVTRIGTQALSGAVSYRATHVVSHPAACSAQPTPRSPASSRRPASPEWCRWRFEW